MINDINKLVGTVVEELKDFTDIAVLGMSGGADSTLVATLCAMALGSINVYGYGMPYNQNDEDTFNSMSAKIATKLGVNYKEISIHSSVISLGAAVLNATGRDLSSLNFGNIKSRARMTLLYSLNAQLAETTGKRCRVIGTGNLSEDYIGYDTKGGDALADIFPIGSLFKSEVYQLLDYFASIGYIGKNMIDRVPSAGLEDGQTDEEDLGYTYNEMEPAIRYLQSTAIKPADDEVAMFVNLRHENNKHKHEASKVIDLRRFNGLL